MNHLSIRLSILVIILFGCADKPDYLKELSIFEDTVLREVYQAAYERDTSAVLAFTQHETPAYRSAAAKLFGSLNSGNCPEEIQELLTDPIPYVRLYAAFAVGQSYDQEALPALEKAMKKATIPEIKAELLEAIGKCAEENAMEFLVYHNPNTSIEEVGKLRGIYRGALKGLLRQSHVPTVVAHLSANEAETRKVAAEILIRQRKTQIQSIAEDVRSLYERESEPIVKTLLIRLMDKCEVKDEFFIGILEKEADPLIRTEAIRSIEDPKPIRETLEEIATTEEPWPAATAANKLAEIDSISLNQATVNEAYTTDIPEVASLIYKYLLENDLDEASRFYESVTNRWNNQVKEGVLIQSYRGRIDSLKQYLLLDNPLGTAAWTAFTESAISDPELRPMYKDYANRALQEGLPALSILIAQSARDPLLKDLIGKQALERSLKNFEEPEFIEAEVEIKKTLREEFNQQVEEAGRNSSYGTIDWDYVRSLGKKLTLQVFTGSDNFTMELLPEDAPVSVAQIAKLTEEGFFDQTYFHRVVPGFVTQGGGPRGDGFGSGEDLLRSEFSPLSFGKGVVGLASAGRDTESCQFFITHLPTPHLDGRYTVIGATRDPIGFLETGAKIDSIRIRRKNQSVERNP